MATESLISGLIIKTAALFARMLARSEWNFCPNKIEFLPCPTPQRFCSLSRLDTINNEPEFPELYLCSETVVNTGEE
jgi:hypothetical protein